MVARGDPASEHESIEYIAAQPGVRASRGADFVVYTRNNVLATQRLLEDAGEYECMARAANPYEDGHAAERIVTASLGEQVNLCATDAATRQVTPVRQERKMSCYRVRPMGRCFAAPDR